MVLKPVSWSVAVALSLGSDGRKLGWPDVVTEYRSLLGNYSKNISKWAATTRQMREWMQIADPDYPIYHLAAPEGWVNDPNGVTYDEKTGLYHRFYQYDKTWSDECRHGSITACDPAWVNPAARTWGHTVSSDLATWEDWPGIDADTPWDHKGVWSGNCAFDDTGEVVCIYSGYENSPCDVAVCARSTDWLRWKKAACMSTAPSAESQVNHDTAIWRDGPGGTWYILSGGCTYAGGNDPAEGGGLCQGNAQLWSSKDLRNFTYEHPIARGGPGDYWELPYVLPFTKDGEAIDNYHHNEADVSVLLFGLSNTYWVGQFDSDAKRFTPLDGAEVSLPLQDGSWKLSAGSAARDMGQIGGPMNVAPSGPLSPAELHSASARRRRAPLATAPPPPAPAWPAPRDSDTDTYYSFNPHATDNNGAGGKTRRLMFGWIRGGPSEAVHTGSSPYWEGAHSIARLVTVRGDALVQLPAPEMATLRGFKITAQPRVITPGGHGYLPEVRGDALEIIAIFNATSVDLIDSQSEGNPFSFGLTLRAGGSFGGFNVTLAPGSGKPSIGVGARGEAGWDASIAPAELEGTAELHVFLDRSIVEVYSGGAAYTRRTFLPTGVSGSEAVEVDAWSRGGNAQLLSLEAWPLSSMWGTVWSGGRRERIVI